MAAILAVTCMANAVDLQLGPLVFKTFNWEVSMGYDGTIGYTYFRDATTPGYDPLNPTHRLFSDPTFVPFVSGEGLLPGEDSFGLLDLTQLWDGTVTGGGTDIASGVKYWDKGDNDEYLRGMFWGTQDQRVYFADDGLGGKSITIYSTNTQYNLYSLNWDYTQSPQVDPDLQPGDRDGQNYFTGWRSNGEGILQAEGTSSFFRFIGVTESGSVYGQSLLFLDVDGGVWNPLLDDFWTVPNSVDGLFTAGAPTDLKQTWTILEEGGPWTKSEDVGKGYVIPEPATIGLLGLGMLAAFRRRWRI